MGRAKRHFRRIRFENMRMSVFIIYPYGWPDRISPLRCSTRSIDIRCSRALTISPIISVCDILSYGRSKFHVRTWAI